MDWGNAYVRTITRDASNVISAIDLELHLEGDFKKTKKKITWLSSSPTSPLVPVVLLDFDYLITKTKLEEDDEINDFINPITEFQVAATADHNLATLTKGDVIQFERKGYYIVDKAFGQVSDLPGSIKESVELILIPDGKAANVALKALPVVKSKTPLVKKVSTAPSRIPEPAPSEPVETTLKSEGNRGFDIKVTTKMYRIPNICQSLLFSTCDAVLIGMSRWRGWSRGQGNDEDARGQEVDVDVIELSFNTRCIREVLLSICAAQSSRERQRRIHRRRPLPCRPCLGLLPASSLPPPLLGACTPVPPQQILSSHHLPCARLRTNELPTHPDLSQGLHLRPPSHRDLPTRLQQEAQAQQTWCGFLPPSQSLER